jgi:asparagine synthase (glutamine-hydrolysing)
MCGIVGIFRFDGKEIDSTSLTKAVATLNKRGPDNQGIHIHRKIGLGHTRLAIIDPEPASNQPFQDVTGRYTLVFNGEIFNFKTLRKELEKSGIDFRTKSDTEVLLQLLIKEGTECLQKLNGFFSFAFFDNQTQQLLLVRDRFGVKPLYICQTDKFLAFGSEMKALEALGIPKELDEASLLFYFQLNYIPSPNSIYKGVKKLNQATWLKMDADGTQTSGKFYELKIEEKNSSYEQKQIDLKNLLTQSVQDRLVSDVPLGVFLSGGVDSSIVSLLAKRHNSDIHSFSVGFKDSEYHDESIFAEKVAKHLDLKHHTFYLTNQEMLDNLDGMLDYIDEPFADSSAIAVYNLCKQTRQHVTVALTGDGADEVFGGYNKHLAESKIRKKSLLNSILGVSNPIINQLPESRSGIWGNEFRKIKKYSRSVSMSTANRYWSWCSFNQEKEVIKMFSVNIQHKILSEEYKVRKEEKLKYFKTNSNIENILASDMDLVLEGDMLVKADRMSMANSVELRNPFLDHRIVDFAFSLNQDDKVSENTAKKILKDTFKPYLPFEVFARPKHGFEVPILNWLKNDLKILVDSYLSESFIEQQRIFDINYISDLKKQLHSNNPGDLGQRIWGLLVFQIWWKRNMS